MDRQLICRAEADVEAFFATLEATAIAARDLRRDPLGNVIYATATRA